eukprot:scaffold3936_cov128-Isochrysis_galbana.AAC.9
MKSTRPSHSPQPCIPEIIGRAPGEMVKGGCRRVPCRKARPRCGRGQVRVVWRRACRERLAPGLGCCRSVGRS